MSSANHFDTMQAVVAKDFGTPASSQLEISNIKTPVIGDPDDVLIKVVAASLNPVDYKIVHGDLNSLLSLDKPVRLGFDVSGTVQQVGAGVTKFKVGDQVYARVDHDRRGTFSTYTLTSQKSLAFKPKTLSHDQAAAVPLAALTALQSLRVANTKAGDRVLILGGSGGVGTFAIQIAKHVIGAAEVITTVSSSGAAIVRELGATRTIDYKTEKFNEILKDVDVVFDTTGEANSAFSVLKKGGTVVSIVSAPTAKGLSRGGIEVGLPTQAFLTAAAAPTLANAALHSANYEFVWMRPSGEELTELAHWIDAGKVKPIIDSTFTFTQVKQAFDYLEQGRAKGKVILHVQDA